MNKQDYLTEIITYIETLVNRVRALNALNYYDINISSEHFFSGLLNLVYNWDLKNLNNEKRNAVSIDLYDDTHKVAVQVTSDRSSAKIHDTIKKFTENKFYEKYDRLLVMVIDNKDKYTAEFQTNGLFEFNKDTDIITVKKLLIDISNLETARVKKILEYLEFEIGTLLDVENIWNIQQAFETIENATNGVITRDYFIIDDKEFSELFSTRIEENENLFIKCYSKEESLYCVLNQLENIDNTKPVYVIRNEKTWNVAKEYLSDSILIPFFFANEISAIRNNINIIISNNDSSTVNQKYIEMRRRKTRTLIDNLKCDTTDAYKLIHETNGLFPFIKRKLFNGDMKNPNWAGQVSYVVLTALLVGKWTEREGDKKIIEDLSGIDFRTFILELTKLDMHETPFIIKTSGRGSIKYQIADIALSWSILKDYIDDDFIKKFLKKANEIILSKDPLFDLPSSEHFYGSIRAEKSIYSNEIRHGILRSMIFIALNGRQELIDYHIKNILSKVDSLSMWQYISQFAEEICEASPCEFINKIENSLSDDTFLELFTSDNDDFITSRHYYTHVLWALKKFFVDRTYVFRTINILIELKKNLLKNNISNQTESLLSMFFCTWLNITSAQPDEKLNIAERGVSKYDFMWDIIFDTISGNMTTMPGTNPSFAYRKSDDIPELTNMDVYTQRMEYLKLVRKYTESDCDRCCKLIDLFKNVSDDILEQMLDELNKNIECMDDADREKVKSKLRRVTNKHRYFRDSEWAKGESWITKIEKVCKNIKFDNPLYDFLYITVPDYDIAIYNPPAMSDGHQKLDEARAHLLESEFALFKKLQLKICDLIKLCQDKHFEFGYNIAKYYSCDKFDGELFKQMLGITGVDNVSRGYTERIYWANSNVNVIEQALKLCKDSNKNEDLYVKILAIPPFSEEILKLVNKQDINVQGMYYNQKIFSLNGSEQFCDVLLSACIKHGAANSLIRILYDIKEIISIDELINYLHKFKEIVNSKFDNFLFVELVKYIHQNIKGEYSKYQAFYEIELAFYKILDWENMMCLQHLFKTDASVYAELISIVLKTEDGAEPTEKQLNLAQYYYDLYYCANFCPGEVENKINGDILAKWISSFKDCLSRQNQFKHFCHLLGRLFAYSPTGTDGYYPHESIREIIEEYYSNDMQTSYVSSEFNKRGVYTCDDGETEKQLSLRYKENADNIRINYPKTAEIFDKLSNQYLADSKAERERAENGEW